jgi:hypothetical protein
MFSLRSRQALAAAVALAGAMLPSAADAQVYVPRYNWTYYGSPATAASAAIHAHADYLRAYGEASVNIAEARRIHADAYRQELVNAVEEVRAYWTRRSIGEAELWKRYHHSLDSQKLQNSKTWERLKNHPDLTGPQIINGTALNFLLNRLGGTVLSYEFSGGQSQNPDIIKQLSLDPETIHKLKLRQRTTNNQNMVFRADEGTGLSVDWWPFALTAPEFENNRFLFEQARDQVVKEAQGGRISHETIRGLDGALIDLRAAFEDRFAGQAKVARDGGGNRMTTWTHYNTAKRFLQSLSGEVLRLAQTQKSAAFDGTLKFEGDNAIHLLTYMSRNGLDFAPAEPGDENAYHNLFHMMRDLYLLVAESDAAIKPVVPNPVIGEK